MEIEATDSCIGIDDFSIKKGQSYCTVICNADTHVPIAVLDGRDGSSLREWLRKNKQVKTITRDRASAYAKVIKEELPDTMQIADRFHLHQNLFDIIKKCISLNLPSTMRIGTDSSNADDNPKEKAGEQEALDDASKKNATQCG